MTKKEYEVLDRWADRYDVTYKPTDSYNTLWDFTYKRNDKKYYCEMKQRNFTLDYAMEKYTEGLLLEAHKYERILRRTKNEKSAQGLYFNFFSDDKALVFNLNKIKIDKWMWRTMPETTDFTKRKFVYKYVTFLDYSKGKLFYI
jgi:hypothetical protein